MQESKRKISFLRRVVHAIKDFEKYQDFGAETFKATARIFGKVNPNICICTSDYYNI